MKAIKNILNRYRWDFIGVWSAILTGCIGSLMLFSMLIAAGCNRISSKYFSEKQVAATKEVIKTSNAFSLSEIPSTLTTPEQRAEYLVMHYWDNLNFSDTTWLASPESIEQAFADYLDMLPHATESVAAMSMRATLVKARASQPVFDWVTEMYDKYLYDANSPFRNEERYAVVLEHIIADKTLDSVYKIRPAFQLEQINKNRLGTMATDFTYTLFDGTKGKLHGIRADYTLLFFSNPGCADCKRTKQILEESEKINGLTGSGKMRVLALFPDEELGDWRAACQSVFPSGWLNARDASPGLVVKNKLYAIRAIPSLYLLDAQKRVILRDATAEQVMGRLNDE